jgi:hypothetical protein
MWSILITPDWGSTLAAAGVIRQSRIKQMTAALIPVRMLGSDGRFPQINIVEPRKKQPERDTATMRASVTWAATHGRQCGSFNSNKQGCVSGDYVLFIAVLTHPPELCFAAKGQESELAALRQFFENRGTIAKEAGVKVHGEYVNTNEHTFYFVLEADSYGAISTFLRPPLLTHHTAKITPVTTIEETLGLPFAKT